MAQHKYKSFKLIEFNVKDIIYDDDENSENSENSEMEEMNLTDESDTYKKKNKKEFIIQMFGINEHGKTCSIMVKEYNPFFYIKVPYNWSLSDKIGFLEHIKNKLGKYFASSITCCKLIKRKKLYGFDGGKEYKFLLLKFKNISTFYKARNFWYNKKGKLIEYSGYKKTKLHLYEANIPPLLRFFHIKNISPSGWISICNKYKLQTNTTLCNYEYELSYKNIVSLPNKETMVPYKICSFDIEASSSHGDFPLPQKDYKKLASNIINEIIDKNIVKNIEVFIKQSINTAFDYGSMENIDLVYPKKEISKERLEGMINVILNYTIETDNLNMKKQSVESMFNRIDDNEEYVIQNKYREKKITGNLIDIILDNTITRDQKTEKLNAVLNNILPPLEGDKTTFIGSTFTRYGEETPYLNHCIALDTCDSIDNTKIESYKTEREVLLAWQKLIQKEDPDIIIGYNIFGFDYLFLYKRAIETGCVNEFLKFSRNRNELSGKVDYNNPWEVPKIEESSIVIASGQHDLYYIKMNGRIQIDLYNYFRKSVNLEQYKLDYVSGHFIGDIVKNITNDNGINTVYSNNLAGLKENDYISFEIVHHTNDKYNEGEKFKINTINKEEGYFTINGNVDELISSEYKIRWCLAKDDVTPQDIFRLTNEGPTERAIVAKYCIQDCNLVYELLKKIDIITEFIEMSKLCSVPISFLVFRGQGIKLTSFISKKCREKQTLMPVIEKSTENEGYEGATVLEPKCNLYLEDPVACVDYSSLYPSSMISENICHSSKVWTKEYDLDNNLIKETGSSKYDNLDDYTYVNINYDTFIYVRKSPKAAAKKVKTGYKICRFAEHKEGKAIIPSVLQELLNARKATKKLKSKEQDPFMKNILDKRQLSIKLTANSLYGQTGAKTSTFYEIDVAASTTAIGRKLLTYAKRVIEEVYGDTICETKNYGKVRVNARYIYGDTDSVFFCLYLKEFDGTPIKNNKALEITIELSQEIGSLASQFLKGPHDLEYEKTFLPFGLLSKKRYFGILYEFDHEYGKIKSMGIVLKRRDNAPIVKDIYGGVIDILMKEKNIESAIKFLQDCLENMVKEKYPMNKLVITKSIRGYYKNPQQIAHKVLADRIADRDPGNKPKSGDRIPYVFIVNDNKKALQGEKIELPNFIITNKLKIDYAHYITNQIMKPVQQLFALVLYEIPSFKNKIGKMKRFIKELDQLKKTMDNEKYIEKEEKMKNKEIKTILFDKYIRMCKNDNQSIIDKYFI